MAVPSARQKTVTESTTDPDSGVFQKGEHRKCFAYEAHTVCDRRGYVLETEVTPGNVHDSVAFDTVFERLIGALSRSAGRRRRRGLQNALDLQTGLRQRENPVAAL